MVSKVSIMTDAYIVLWILSVTVIEAILFRLSNRVFLVDVPDNGSSLFALVSGMQAASRQYWAICR